jgi:predicted phage terminase large subunit-like protein
MNTIPIQLTPDEFDAMTRLDLSTFIERVFYELNPTTPYLDNFHIHVIAAALEAMRRGEKLRLIFDLPPRNLKSLIVSVAYVAWLLGHDPSTKIICVSYGQELAENLARQCRQVMQSEWYQRLFPKTRLSPARQAAESFETTAGGCRIATSTGGPLTGLGADYILIDDPVKPQEAFSEAERTRANLWYQHSLVTRLNDKRRGRIVIVMQRLHEDDMVGHVLTLDHWNVFALSAIAPADETYVIPTAFGTWTHRRREGEALHPDREPLEVLETYRRNLGPEFFAAQFLQAPVPPGGNMVKLDWFQRFDIDMPPTFEHIVHSWDTASKATQLSGYSVCTIWGMVGRRLYLIDVIRARFEYPELRATALALARGQYRGHRKPDLILIEDKASGQSLIQDLKQENIRNIQAVEPEADKTTRMYTQTAVIANGHVMIPQEAPWLADYLQEMIAFPKGRYSDQVDSTSQALKWFNYQPDEPAIITFYREEYERMRAAKGGVKDENRIVTMRFSGEPTTYYARSTDVITIDADGLYRMKWRDAQDLLGKQDWSLIEEP